MSKEKVLDFIFIFLGSFFCAYPIYLCGIYELDEGSLLHIAERITKGELLYRDIATGVMPGIYYLQAVLFLLFGYSVEVGRYLQMIILATNASLLYFISRRFIKRGGSIWVATLFAVVNLYSYRFPNYSPVSILFILLGFLCLLCYLSKEKNIYIILSGFTFAVSFLFKQNYGFLVFLSVFLFTVVRAITGRYFKSLILFLISFILPILLTMTYFYFNDALAEMVQYALCSVFSKGLPVFYKPYPLLDLKNPFYFIGDVSSFSPFLHLTNWLLQERFISHGLVYGIVLITYLLPLLIILASAVYLGIKFIRKGAGGKEITLLLSSIGLFWGVFPRADFYHLATISPFLLVVGGIIVQRMYDKGGLYIKIPLYVLLPFLAFLFVFSTYFPMFPHFFPDVQDTPLAVERAERIKVSKNEAETIRSITGYLKERTKEDEAILTIPAAPIYYFLSDRKNPTPYPLILPGAFDEDAFIKILSKVGYIIYSDKVFDVLFDKIFFPNLFPRTAQYLSTNFVIDKDFLSMLTIPAPVGCSVFVLKRGKSDTIASGLINYLNEANKGIIKRNAGLIPLTGQDLIRIKQMIHSIALRPPSDFQKLSLSYRVIVPLMARLNFSLALRPPEINANADGAVFEIYIYDMQRRRSLKIFTKNLDPINPYIRHWQDFEIDLSSFAEKEVILSFVCFSGPTLDEVGDEIFLGEPGIITDGINNDLMVSMAGELPEDAVLDMGAFNDPEIFEQAIKVRPDNPKILLNLATVYVNLNRHDEALNLLKKAVILYGDDPGINSALAELYWSKEESLLAYGEYEKVLKRDKNNLRALTMLAEINLVAMKDPQQAYYFIKRAKRIAPNDAGIYLKMGRVYLSMDKAKEATEEFKKVLELVPNNLEALEYINAVFQGKKLVVNDSVLSRADAPLPDKAFKADIKPKGQIPEVMEVGSLTNVHVKMKNSSAEIWPALGKTDGKYRISIGYRWFDINGNLVLEGGRTPLSRDMNPDTEIILNVTIRTPGSPGNYVLKIDMVQEFVCWFEERGQGTQGVESLVKVRRDSYTN